MGGVQISRDAFLIDVVVDRDDGRCIVVSVTAEGQARERASQLVDAVLGIPEELADEAHGRSRAWLRMLADSAAGDEAADERFHFSLKRSRQRIRDDLARRHVLGPELQELRVPGRRREARAGHPPGIARNRLSVERRGETGLPSSAPACRPGGPRRRCPSRNLARSVESARAPSGGRMRRLWVPMPVSIAFAAGAIARCISGRKSRGAGWATRADPFSNCVSRRSKRTSALIIRPARGTRRSGRPVTRSTIAQARGLR